jgi:type IV pilus assembly protein PilC
MHTGVPVTEALEISMESMSFPGYRKTSQEILNQVISGKSLSEAFKDTKAFPPLLTQMILSGEKSGTLDTSIKDLGIFYEEEVESTVKKATQILEPVLMLLVGVGVGAMILAVIVPIYSVVSNLQAEM